MIAVILNPASGQARRAAIHDEVATLCRRAGLDVHIPEFADPDRIAAAARDALATHPDVLVAGGGDGTVSTVAGVLAGTAVPLGVLPLGTMNHFAKDLNIPIDLAKAVEVIASRHVQRVDVGRVNNRVFINNSSLGVYPSIVEVRERLRHDGRAKWTALALATLEVLRQDTKVSIRLQADHTRIVANTPFVFVGNNEYVAEGVRLGGRTRLDGRRVHVYFAAPVRTRHLPNLFAHALFGLATREHALTSLATAELWIDTPDRSSISVACDGEVAMLQTPLHYRSWPGALNVISPGTT